MWFKIEGDQVFLQVYVKPNAKRTDLLKIENNKLHISLHAKPHDGEANKELISYLSYLFKVPKSMITLRRGQSSRYKEIIVPLTIKIRQILDDLNQI